MQEVKSTAKFIAAQRYVCVLEDLPPPFMIVVIYCEVFGTYHLAHWSAAGGWQDICGSQLRYVTHWNTLEVGFPFEIRNSYDPRAAQYYDIRRLNSRDDD